MPTQVHILTSQNRDRILGMLAKLDLSKAWELTLKPYRKKRSEAQNARLWSLHTLAAKVTGYSAEEMHEFALCRFYGTQEVTLGNIVRHIPMKRSSARDVKEFAEFMDSTEEWYVSEFGVWLS